jgi:hypothetical protein
LIQPVLLWPAVDHPLVDNPIVIENPYYPIM